MKKSITFQILSFLVVLFTTSLVHGAVVLEDNFDTGIDTSVWATLDGTRGGSIVWDGTNKNVQINKRAFILTKEQYNPSLVGGLSLSGTWKCSSSSGMLIAMSQVENPSTFISDGFMQNALFGRVRNDQNLLTLTKIENGTVTSYSETTQRNDRAVSNLHLADGCTFTYVDTGSYLALKVKDSEGYIYQMQKPYTPYSQSSMYAGFSNRETDTATLDNVVIKTLADEGTYDSFSETQVDLTQWTIRGGSRDGVVIDQGRVKMINRSGISSLLEYKPDGVESHILTVSGDLTWGVADDMFTLLLRSDNSNATAASHVNNGLQFQTNIASGWSKMNISQKGENYDIKILESDADITYEVGKTYHFDIQDDGTNVSWSVYDLENPDNSGFFKAIATLKEGSTYDSNYVVFYNREDSARYSYLDNLSIDYSYVPEPGSWVLMTLGLGMLLYLRQRKNNA